MKMRALFLFSGFVSLSAAVPLHRAGNHLFVDGVCVNGRGPYRFLLDTGAQSTVIDPALAGSAGLRPTYRVQVVSVNGEHLAPGGVASVSLDGRTVQAEVLSYSMEYVRQVDASVAGVLGQSFLSKFAYYLDLRRGWLSFDEAPGQGRAVKLEMIEGRPAVFGFVLDTGAACLVLFDPQARDHPLITPGTPALTMGREGRREVGLLPPQQFLRSVYVDAGRGFAVLER